MRRNAKSPSVGLGTGRSRQQSEPVRKRRVEIQCTNHSSKINTRPLVECNAALIKICCFCVPQKGDAILVTAMNASGVWKGMVKGCDRVGTFKFGKVQPLVHESNGLEKNCAQNAKHRPKSLLQLLRTIGMEARICLSFVFRPFGSVPYCFYFVSGYTI